jgi:hypothetical protein
MVWGTLSGKEVKLKGRQVSKGGSMAEMKWKIWQVEKNIKKKNKENELKKFKRFK